jgi:hypothetical protein
MPSLSAADVTRSQLSKSGSLAKWQDWRIWVAPGPAAKKFGCWGSAVYFGVSYERVAEGKKAKNSLLQAGAVADRVSPPDFAILMESTFVRSVAIGTAYRTRSATRSSNGFDRLISKGMWANR